MGFTFFKLKINRTFYIRFSLLLLVFALGILNVLGSGCAPRQVVISGKVVLVTDAPRLLFEEAQVASKAGKNEVAMAKLSDLVTHYSDDTYVPEALFVLGTMQHDRGREPEAAAQFTRLVEKFPRSSRAVPCAIQLEEILSKLGRASEALSILENFYGKVADEAKKPEVVAALVHAASEANAPVRLVRWFTLLYTQSTDPQKREEVSKDLAALIDQRLSFTQVREAVEILKDESIRSFPMDVLLYKLAKIFYHIHDYDRSRETLESFVATFPRHEFAEQANALIKRIKDRNLVVPRAIGVLLPLTGVYREYGNQALEGIKLGMGIFETEGKETAPMLIIRDTAGKPEQAIAQLEDLVFNEHVSCVIGPMFRREAYPAAVKADELEVPIIILGTRSDITSIGSFVFHNFLTLEAQAKTLVSYAIDQLGVKRFGTLYPNEQSGVDFNNAFWDEVRRRKGEVRAAELYEPDTKNFVEPIRKLLGRPIQQKKTTKLKGEPPKYPPLEFEALFVPEEDSEKVAMIAPALAFEDIVLMTDDRNKIERIKKSLKSKSLDMIYVLGGSGWNSPKVIEWAGRYVQGAIFCDGFFSETSWPAARQFVERFKNNFERDPGRIEAYAYDTARIVRKIVEQLKPADRSAFREALLKTKDFNGATGLLRFTPQRYVEKDLFLLTINGDEIQEIDRGSQAHGPKS
jgi:ABC-type branched-chain amino acid transport systems, periplasmic component